MHKLAQCVLVYIRKRELLSPGDRLGIAVSGGADSVALLRLMLELRDEMGVVLSVVHLNHKLRGVDSEGDEQFVRDLAKAHGLEIIAEGRVIARQAPPYVARTVTTRGRTRAGRRSGRRRRPPR